MFYRSKDLRGPPQLRRRAAGLEQLIDYINNLHFSEEDLSYLLSLKLFDDAFINELRNFHFSGDIDAIPEGTMVFPASRWFG